MHDESETLDWGNEEEENQELHRKHSSSGPALLSLCVDDVEDTISLGDEDDDQGFYPYSDRTDTRTKQNNPAHENFREHSPLGDASGNSTSRTMRRSLSKGSPPGSFARMTHALPPRPPTLAVPVLTPSHSSMIAATSMTSPLSAARDSKKVNGKPAAADLPQDWETRVSRKNEVYYYNRVTHESTWSRPVSKLSVSTPTATQDDSGQSRRQRHSVSPDGSKPKESNSNTSQTSGPKRDSSRNGQSDPGNEDGRRTLTYEDRHYRPGESFPTSNTVRAVERLEISPKAGRYARSQSPRRRRARSVSPDTRGTESRARATDSSPRSGREKSAYTNPAPKIDSYVPGYERRRSSSPRPLSLPDYQMRLDREPQERAARRPLDQDTMSIVPPPPDYRSGRSSGRKEEPIRTERGRSRDRNPPIRNLDPGHSAKQQSNYVSAQRSRSPPPHQQLQERDRGRQVREPDLRRRNRERERERNYDGPPRYRDSPPFIPPSVSESRDSDMMRGEPPSMPEGTSHSQQRRSDNYPSGPNRTKADDSQGTSGPESKSVSGDAFIPRAKRAPLPPQQASFRSARLKDPPHTPLKPTFTGDGGLGLHDNVPRYPRSQARGAQPDVGPPRNDSRQNDDGLTRTRSSSDMKMDVDQDEVLKAGRRLSALGERSPPRLTERSRPPEFESQFPSRTSPVPDRRRPDNLPSETPCGPAASSRDSSKYVHNDDRRPDGRSGRDEGDRALRPTQSERNMSRRNREPPNQPAARLTGTNSVPMGNRRSAGPPSRPSPGTPRQLRPPVPEPIADKIPTPLPTNPPPRDLPPGKECYERPPDLVISEPLHRGSRDKNRPRESRFSRKQDDRAKMPVPQSVTAPERIVSDPVNRPLKLNSRDFSDSTLNTTTATTTPKAPIPRPTDGFPDDRFNGSVFGAASSVQSSSKPREGYNPARDAQYDAVQQQHRPVMTERPRRTSADDIETLLPQRLRASDEVAPPPSRLVVNNPGRHRARDDNDDDLPNDLIVHKDVPSSKLEAQSPFISRVEPPRSGSLLDRLSIDDNRRGSYGGGGGGGGGRLAPPLPPPSLRDRLVVPLKRDRDEMLKGEGVSGRPEPDDRFYERDDAEPKRMRRRGGKARRSGGGGGGGGGNGRRI